jgi:hypothetical protein
MAQHAIWQDVRRRWVWRNGELVEVDLNAPRRPSLAPYVISDLAEYRSVLTREMITSRSQHREHLRAHGCIEVGNEMPCVSREALPPVREDIAKALEASPELRAEARSASERAGKVILP